MSEDLKLLIRAGNPLISIETTDEPRAIELVEKVAGELNRPLFEWSMTDGLRTFESEGTGRLVVKRGQVSPALLHIRDSRQSAVYLFKDLGPHCKDALVHRTLRDLIQSCEKSQSSLIMVDALPLPDQIKRFTVRYDLDFPSTEELELTVRDAFKKIRDESLFKITANITRREMEQLVQSLRGLSCKEAERVIAWTIYDDNTLDADDLPRVVEAKRTLLGSAGCLESIAADFNSDDIGGLDNLKEWLKLRRGGFSRKAREFGLDSPRGVLMLGVPGCGKSLCAKVVAADWKMPLLRLDPGMLFQKFIGESESQLRQALAQAEAMAPVVLWIDEIEKAFASATASSADGGLSKRMFGTLLSWMQDHRHPIFMIATANDVSSLPPELMRKGRFDEIFFVDLPAAEARRQILSIHLGRRKREPKNFDLQKLATAAEGFTGAELEQAVVSGLFTAFHAGTELADQHILDAIGETRPLSVLMSERIESLRQWAQSRCVFAD